MTWEESEKRIFLSRIYELKARKAYEQMEEEVKTALERYPSDPNFQVLLAEVHYRRGRRAQARTLLGSLEDCARHLAEFQALQATLQIEQRQYRQALESYRQAHSIRPSDFYLKRQADCLLHLGSHREAVALLRALPNSEQDRYALSSLARAYEAEGRIEEALACYDRVLELAPDNSFAASRALKLRAQGKQKEELEQEVDRMLRLPSKKQDCSLLKLKAEQLRDKGECAEAAQIYGKLAELAPEAERDFYRRSLAYTCYRGGLYEDAYPLLVRLVEENPDDPCLRNTLLAAARKLGRSRELAPFFRGLAGQSPAHRRLYGVARKLKNL